MTDRPTDRVNYILNSYNIENHHQKISSLSCKAAEKILSPPLGYGLNDEWTDNEYYVRRDPP